MVLEERFARHQSKSGILIYAQYSKVIPMTNKTKIRVHPSAEISDSAVVGDGTSIWNNCQIREQAQIGQNCILGKDTYIDINVTIGNQVKIQNGVSIFYGTTLEDGVFCGPHSVFTNDRVPRAVNPDGTSKLLEDWEVSKTLIRKGASIGANATILCGLTVGTWAMIGAGSIVTSSVPDYGLVYGAPARLAGYVCKCGAPLIRLGDPRLSTAGQIEISCDKCQSSIAIDPESLGEKTK